MDDLLKSLLKKFNPLVFKAIVTGLVVIKPYAGVTEEFLTDFRAWFMDDENFKWLLDKRQEWEDKG